jgi:hypothetical protein
VQAFLPITLQGQLETGESVTLLNAQNHGGALGTPRYVAAGAVLGAHVTVKISSTQPCVSAWIIRIWLNHLVEGEPGVLEDDGSTLDVETSDDGNWLIYSSSTPATLRQLEIRVVSGCLVLAQLAIGLEQELVTRQTEVRVASGEPCLTVHGRESARRPVGSTLRCCYWVRY